MRISKFCLVLVAAVMVTVLVVFLGGSYRTSKADYFGKIQKKVRESMNYFHDDPELTPRKIILTSEEEKNIKLCTDTKDEDITKANNAFWPGETSTVRWTSHTYLTNQSMILDIGGSIGLDAEEFIKRYNSKLVIFEPLIKYTSQLRAKFNGNSKVKILGLGLGKEDAEMYMEEEGKNGEASSLYSGKTASNVSAEKVTIKDTTKLFAQIGLGSHFVDLLHMDCEGCEIDVLEELMETNIISNLKHIQFATHTRLGGIENLIHRYCRLQEILKRTHKTMYQYKFVWESWEMKAV